MKNYVIVCLLGLGTLLPDASRAEEKLATLKIGIHVYTNVTVTSVTDTDIYFQHAGGMGNGKLKRLSPELQKHFGFNQAAGQLAEKQQNEANARFYQGIASQGREIRAQAREATPQTQTKNAQPTAEPRAPQLHAKSFRGQQAPELIVETWVTPEPATQGKFVLVDFWATWCGPCRRSIPELNALQAKFKDRLVVIGLSDEPERTLRKFANPKINYTVATDTRARTMNEAQVQGIPHAMLIDPNGVVRYEGMPQYLTASGLELLLDRYGK